MAIQSSETEKDVFISYSHSDDKPLDTNAVGWISDFHSLLEMRLEQTIGYEINIWRDKRLHGNDIFGDEIESQLNLLKVMVSIITPKYLSSAWCRKEIGTFYKAAQKNGGISVGNKSRIFKVMKTPVDREEIDKLPDDLRKIFDEVLDYKFYQQDKRTGRFRELSRQNWVNDSIKQEYMEKLDDVTQDMVKLIKNLKKANKETVTGNNNPVTDDLLLLNIPAPQKKIYLAETTYDLQGYRDNLVRELQEGGFIVLPDKNLPFVYDRYVAEVEGYLDQSILSVHLISATNYAIQPEGADKSAVMIQNDLAADKSRKNNLNRLIWIPPPHLIEGTTTAVKADERQQAFTNQVRTNATFQEGADILEGQLEELKQSISDTVKRLENEKKARQEAALKEAEDKAKKETNPDVAVEMVKKAELKYVYLICDQRDEDSVTPVINFLVDEGNEILLPLFTGEQADLRQAHMDNLKICDAVIIYWGNGNQPWVRSMKSDLMRLPAMERKKPLLDKFIYIDNPKETAKDNFRANDMAVLDGRKGFAPSLFNAFIKNLNQ